MADAIAAMLSTIHERHAEMLRLRHFTMPLYVDMRHDEMSATRARVPRRAMPPP